MEKGNHAPYRHGGNHAKNGKKVTMRLIDMEATMPKMEKM
jgi:hypothetical protein